MGGMFGACLAEVVPATTGGSPVVQDPGDYLPLLSASFNGVTTHGFHNADGSYNFSFSIPQQARQEARAVDGKVTGYFAFVDRVGEEVSVHYDADEDGFRPASDALPQVPQETEEVSKARLQFNKYFDQTEKFLKELGSSGEDDSSSHESDEDIDEDSDESDESDELERIRR
ncbi:endocuticle structural glycoprotein SgAbd-9-like [Procambarus clarkii]|uniref:endocuticle structural glycoprotein SgAbd-9-like n=1 Tax=Procambarus clarkii TaxID=6728 RepID=UPI003744AC9E